jgi:SAM-dependent methyltransferase
MIGAIRAIGNVIRREIRRSELLNSTLFVARLVWYVGVRRALRTRGAANASEMTIAHNLKAIGQRLNRMLLLVAPLSSLEQVPRNARILVIGPRNEWDLFLLRQAGFELDRITGLDLISYSPRIELGDMHAMHFADGAFDVVLCGWTLSYSADPALACQEIDRVCRPGGVVGIGVEYFDGDERAEREATGGYLLKDPRLAKRVNSVGAVLDFFPGHGAVLFANDAPLRRSAPRDHLPSNCLVLFETRASVPGAVS